MWSESIRVLNPYEATKEIIRKEREACKNCKVKGRSLWKGGKRRVSA